MRPLGLEQAADERKAGRDDDGGQKHQPLVNLGIPVAKKNAGYGEDGEVDGVDVNDDTEHEVIQRRSRRTVDEYGDGADDRDQDHQPAIDYAGDAQLAM